MKTTEQVLADLQAVIVNLNSVAADLQAIVDAPAQSGVTEVDVQENGQTEKFVPETPAQ